MDALPAASGWSESVVAESPQPIRRRPPRYGVACACCACAELNESPGNMLPARPAAEACVRNVRLFGPDDPDASFVTGMFVLSFRSFDISVPPY